VQDAHWGASGILHIDAHAPHNPAEFRAWRKRHPLQFCAVYVPASCTSEMEFTRVVLNKLIKNNYISSWWTIWLMEEVKRQLDDNIPFADITSSELATAAAEPALGCYWEAYDKLSTTNHKKGLKWIGYLSGWNDNVCVLGSVGSVHVLLREALPN
jgi:hypothetical protein